MSDGSTPREDGSRTAGSEYAQRLRRREGARWKSVLDVQRPYRWNLRRLSLGRVLDVGCGIGRNLKNLGPNSVGVDHNRESVTIAREAGLTAYTTDEFWSTGVGEPGAFDAILLAHVMEHVSGDVANEIVNEYLPCVRHGGKVVFITPQEVGYRSDHTHVRFVDLADLDEHASQLGLVVERAYSFPFPRPAGKVFKYNEFVLVASRP
jgi:2-polyprenyl-3-methyl-5-hydroxy-6-metoxy-1,4-benzoquinol methylase